MQNNPQFINSHIQRNDPSHIHSVTIQSITYHSSTNSLSIHFSATNNLISENPLIYSFYISLNTNAVVLCSPIDLY